MRDRYEIRQGRFGFYFYDNKQQRDVDMTEALHILNSYGVFFERTVTKDSNG